MSDTAESLLREHFELCSTAYERGLVPTRERHWVDTGDDYQLCRRWYYESDLRARTAALLAKYGESE